MLTLTNLQIAVAVVVVTLITFACRIAPFALLRGRSTSPLLGFLSSAMPLGVMVVLGAYHQADLGETGVRQGRDHEIQEGTTLQRDHGLHPGIGGPALLGAQRDVLGCLAHA